MLDKGEWDRDFKEREFFSWAFYNTTMKDGKGTSVAPEGGVEIKWEKKKKKTFWCAH